MKYFLILLIFITSLFSKEVCVWSEDFEVLSAQKVEVILPKKFKIGENKIEVVLEQPKMPSGYMVPVVYNLVEFKGSVQPEFLNGYPNSSISVFEKGVYKVKITINLIYKSSCGGIQFSNLLTKEIEFIVE